MKLLSLLQKHRKIVIVLAVFLVGLMLISLTMPLEPNLGIVTPGWEIYNQIGAMKYPEGVKSGVAEFTYPNDVSGPMWKVDTDDQYWGMPTIMVQTSDIRHVDFAGKPLADSTPATTPKEVVRGNHKFVLDYHVYMFDVTIRTVADRHTVIDWGIPLTSPYFEHETSWQRVTSAMNPIAYNGHWGKQFNGGTYVKFVISPWRGVAMTDAPENATLAGAWAGVMNSYVFVKEQGQVANQWGQSLNPSQEAPMHSKAGLDNGAQVPMFKDDGAYGNPSPTVNWDTSATPDSRIESTVVLYLPAQLQAGAYLERADPITGTVNQVTPCDVYIKYTIRVDVLTTHDFVLQTAVNPPELDIPTDFFSYVLSWWDNPANQAIVWLLVLGVFALVAFWIYWKYRKVRRTE